MTSSNSCLHDNLRTTPHPSQAQYSRPSAGHRAAAATPSGAIKPSVTDASVHALSEEMFASTFPGPLVFANDDLALDPKYPPQSLRSCNGLRAKNWGRAPGRNVIYVAEPPRLEAGSRKGFMKGWAECEARGSDRKEKGKDKIVNWVDDVMEYLEAFYHPMVVRRFDPSLLQFTPWDSTPALPAKSKSRKSQAVENAGPCYIGVRTSEEIIGVRYRSTQGPYPYQLNLNDLLDAAIAILPEDAHTLLMLVDHDLYEDDDDEFVCGRAFGGSRVAVVSRARYNPALDEMQDVPREHAWPASCCEQYAELICGSGKKRKGGGKKHEVVVRGGEFAVDGSPLHAAVLLHNSLPSLGEEASLETLAGLWLSRICRTASHEIGHCFGIDHCVYYACCMQGSASIVEDARQPPYLCPIDLEKVIKATGGDAGDRYRALWGFCKKHRDIHTFGAFGEWIRLRLKQIEGKSLDGSS